MMNDKDQTREQLVNELAQMRQKVAELEALEAERPSDCQGVEAERWRYQELFEFISDGCLVTDPEGIILEANLSAADLLRFRQGSLVGESLIAFVDKKEHKGFRSQLSRLRSGSVDRVQGWEVQMQTYEGLSFPVAITVAVLRDSQGKLARLRWLLRDITEQVQTDEALWEGERRFRSVAETASDAIIIFDSQENIVFWNQTAKTIFRYPSGETKGKLVATILPRQFQKVFQREMERMTSIGESDLVGKTIEMTGIRKDNQEFPIELSLAGWRSGDEILFTIIVRDITDRKQAEKEREQLILELQDALAQVKTLSGLLPICSSCKKIRDDEGYWNQIEAYIQEHSEAVFSHGLCPECAKKLYPDIFGDDG